MRRLGTLALVLSFGCGAAPVERSMRVPPTSTSTPDLVAAPARAEPVRWEREAVAQNAMGVALARDAVATWINGGGLVVVRDGAVVRTLDCAEGLPAPGRAALRGDAVGIAQISPPAGPTTRQPCTSLMASYARGLGGRRDPAAARELTDAAEAENEP